MKYKCIIFDNDGVLVDSEAISGKVIVEMAQEHGLKIDLHYAIQNFSGVSFQSTMDYIEKNAGMPLQDDFEREFRKRTFALFKTDLKPVAGVKEVLDRLSVPFCVASSGPHEKLQLSLTAANLIHYFENRMFSSYDIGSWKPDPDIFLYAAREMGFEPNECVVIEDSLAGIKAAKAGGFDVFGFVNDSKKKAFEELEVNVFSDMKDLIHLLELD